MDMTQDCSIYRFEAGRPVAATDKVINEARIELDINDGRYRVSLLALPQDLDALAVGFLVGETVLRRREDLAGVEVRPETGRVLVRGRFDDEALEGMARQWTRGTGCGSGGTSRLLAAAARTPLAAGLVVAPERLIELTEELHARAGLWRETGGVHACALASADGIVGFAEDIGRHNAFDKIIGRAFLNNINISDKLVLTTGRISAEIVSKAIACGVPMLVSRSAVTSLAVSLARRFNLTLVGFLRGRRLSVYTAYHRVAGDYGQAGGGSTDAGGQAGAHGEAGAAP